MSVGAHAVDVNLTHPPLVMVTRGLRYMSVGTWPQRATNAMLVTLVEMTSKVFFFKKMTSKVGGENDARGGCRIVHALYMSSTTMTF